MRVREFSAENLTANKVRDQYCDSLKQKVSFVLKKEDRIMAMEAVVSKILIPTLRSVDCAICNSLEPSTMQMVEMRFSRVNASFSEALARNHDVVGRRRRGRESQRCHSTQRAFLGRRLQG